MNLSALLENYRASPQEQPFLARMLELSTLGPLACRRDHYTPGHFTASSFVFSEDLQHTALIFHPKFGRWLQPGGHIESEDPDILAAARREVAEELGLHKLPLLREGLWDLDIHEIPARPNKEPAHCHFDLRFAFVAPLQELRGELEGRWWPLATMDQVTTDESVRRGLRQHP